MMSNKLFEAIGQNAIPNQFMQMMGEINKFAQSIKGNPQQMVQRLLESGEMSQSDFNKYAQMAQQIAPFMGKH